MWIHTCFVSQDCSIRREITSELFLFLFLRFVAESIYDTQQVPNVHRLFDSSRSPTSVLETSSACLDSSIRRGVVPVTLRPLGFFTSRFVTGSIHNTRTPVKCFDFSIRLNPVSTPCFPLTFSFPLRTQLYVPIHILLL